MSTQELLERAKAACRGASALRAGQIDAALAAMAEHLIARTDAILSANA